MPVVQVRTRLRLLVKMGQVPRTSLLYEDEIRSVAVGYAEVCRAGGLEIAFARKREDGPEGTAPVSVLPEQLSRQAGFASSRTRSASSPVRTRMATDLIRASRTPRRIRP